MIAAALPGSSPRRVALRGLAIALGMAAPVAGMAQVETGLSANYRVRVTSWSEIPFRTTVRQQHDFSCGSAALATLLTFHYDRPTPERVAFGAMWDAGDRAAIRRFGFSMLDIKRYLDAAGLKTQGIRVSIDDVRRLGRPGIVILDLDGYRHFVVVKGVVGDRVLVGDPMLGLDRYAVRDFAAHWNGIYLTILDQPGRPRPRFNVASEWRPWSDAPTRAVTDGVPIARITDNLPPIYQIGPATLSTQTGRGVR